MPWGTRRVYNSAAAPASMPPMRKVSVMMRSRDTPIRVAVVESWATARMPRPNLVRLMSTSVSRASTSAAPTITHVTLDTEAPKMWNWVLGCTRMIGCWALLPP